MNAAARIDPATTPNPLEAIARFAATLREHGLDVGIPEQRAMVDGALRIPIERADKLEAAWRAIACHDVRAWRRWPDLFERYWHPHRLRGSTRLSGQTRPRRDLRELVQSLHDQLGAAAPPGRNPAAADTALQASAADLADDGPRRAHGGATRVEALHDRSLAEWLPQDLALLERLAEQIARRLRRRLTRRWHPTAAGTRLDVRRTLRASLRTGGIPVHPVWRSARRERPRLFLLVDVSRSMQTHAQLFLRIARAFVTTMDARVFVFHTRLAEVTPLLRSDSTAVQEKINAVTAGFGGGTRIASSVADFLDVHARAQLTRAARVWMLSDGFDADPPADLAEQLARLRSRGACITWLHPSPEPPASLAMQAVRAKPGLIDRFLRLNSLADLAALAERLA